MPEKGKPSLDYYEKCLFLREAQRYTQVETAQMCRRILSEAKHVSIDPEAIKRFGSGNYEREFSCPSWKDEFIFPQDDKEFVEFLGVSNAVNFAFTNFEEPFAKYCVEYPEGKLHQGSNAMGAALMRAKSEGFPIFSFKYLAGINKEEVSWIFRCHAEGENIPLLEKRFKQIRSFGRTMLILGCKSMADFILAHDHFAFTHSLNGVVYEGFVDALANKFASFYDTSKSKSGLIISFNKRANLLALMYQQRASYSGSELVLLRDVQNIVPIADYQVPRALEAMGLIKYSDPLKRKISERKNLTYGSPAEMEIRAATVVVMYTLLVEINRLRDSCNPPKKEITLCELDSFMWLAGRQAKGGLPHHLTKTTAY